MADLPPVGNTAIGVAAIRAAETARPGGLFSDPFAAGFVHAAGFTPRHPDDAESRARRASLVSWVAVRTRWLDELVLEASKGGCAQVVILGAGLDARAFRLAWPEGVRLFELDLPEVLQFKERVVDGENWRPICERVTVPVDLSDDWGRPLREAGFDAGARVVWVAEGLLAYLSPDASDSLVIRAAELSVPGSRMGVTLASPERLRAWREAHPDGTAQPGDHVALWRSSAPAEVTSWLAAHGWRAEIFDVAERSVAYGRLLDEVTNDANGARLVDATRS